MSSDVRLPVSVNREYLDAFSVDLMKSAIFLDYSIFGSRLLKEKNDGWKEAHFARRTRPKARTSPFHVGSHGMALLICPAHQSLLVWAWPNPKFANPGLESVLRRYTNVPACPPTQWLRL